MTELEQLIRVSKHLAERKELVQGSGGNISIKVDDRTMLIKPSGYTFSEILSEKDFSTVDQSAFCRLYERCVSETTSEDMGEVSKLMTPEQGLRPSMETGFHAFLGKVVIHTHPVVVNAITCSENGERIVASWNRKVHWIPYMTPGHDLALEIYKRRIKGPAAIFLQNHGLIVTGDSIDECMAQQSRALGAASAVLGHPTMAWPETLWTEYLGYQIALNPRLHAYSQSMHQAGNLLQKHLFPDSFVFTDGANVYDSIEAAAKEGVKAAMVIGKGMVYKATRKRAREFDEILTASEIIRVFSSKLDEPRYLSHEHLEDLRKSDAERYRQSLKE